MKQIKCYFVSALIYLAFTANIQASICQNYLIGDENGLKRAWQEYLLTDPNGELSLSRKKQIEDYFTEILISRFIDNFRPDLVNDRTHAAELIADDINKILEYINFKQMLIYKKFESLKQYRESDPERYRHELALLNQNILNLNQSILDNMNF